MAAPLSSVNSINYVGIPCSQCGGPLEGHEVEIHEGGEDHPIHRQCLRLIAEQQLGLEDVSIPCHRCLIPIQVDHLLPSHQIFFKLLHHALSGVGEGALMGVNGIACFAAIDTIKRSILLLSAKAGMGTWPALLGYLLAPGAYGSRDFLVTCVGVILCSSFFAAFDQGSTSSMNSLNMGVADLGGLLIGTFMIAKICKLFNHIEAQRNVPGLSGILALLAFLCIGSFRAEQASAVSNLVDSRLRSMGFASLFSGLIAAQALKGALPDARNRYLAMFCACAFIGMFWQNLFDAREFLKKDDVHVPSPFDLALD